MGGWLVATWWLKATGLLLATATSIQAGLNLCGLIVKCARLGDREKILQGRVEYLRASVTLKLVIVQGQTHNAHDRLEGSVPA
jgi:hypothetical protein